MKLIDINKLEEEGVSHNSKIRKRVILSNGEAPPIINYARSVFPPGEMAGAHVHWDMVEVFTVESGSGVIRINDVEYDFLKDMCTVIEPGELHEIVNTGSDDLVLHYFAVFAK
ncbi:MAG: cupin domain-containing protein [Kiritimatiellales bacterium]|nr:cupin domain-containing protein [Kiritimatiellales bacterium]